MGLRDFDPCIVVDRRFNRGGLRDGLSSGGLKVAVADDLLFDAETNTEHCFLFLPTRELEVLRREDDAGTRAVRRIVAMIVEARRKRKHLVGLVERGYGPTDSAGFSLARSLFAEEVLLLPAADEPMMAKLAAGILAEDAQKPPDTGSPPSTVANMCRQLVGINPKAVTGIIDSGVSLRVLSAMSEEEISRRKNMGKISSRKLFNFFTRDLTSPE